MPAPANIYDIDLGEMEIEQTGNGCFCRIGDWQFRSPAGELAQFLRAPVAQ
jgi:hypothetical protein